MRITWFARCCRQLKLAHLRLRLACDPPPSPPFQGGKPTFRRRIPLVRKSCPSSDFQQFSTEKHRQGIGIPDGVEAEDFVVFGVA